MDFVLLNRARFDNLTSVINKSSLNFIEIIIWNDFFQSDYIILSGPQKILISSNTDNVLLMFHRKININMEVRQKYH